MNSIQIPADILIVDDEPANLKLLHDILSEQGYGVRPAPHGKLALQFVQLNQPDLILLDIIMPGMDGFEVCRRLKADPKTTDIPVIFLSALFDSAEKVKALDIGGVDYVQKPFVPEELLARIRTHLELRQLQMDLEQQVAARTQELSEIATRYRVFVADNPVGVWNYEIRPPMPINIPIEKQIEWILDQSFLVEVNQSMANMDGFSSSEEYLSSRPTIRETYRDAPITGEETVRDWILGGYGFKNYEEEGSTRDGSKVFRLHSGTSVIEDNHLFRIWGTSVDITERKNIDSELRKSRQQLRSLTNHLQSLIEEERAHISREIHDEFGQMLTGLKMDLAWLERRIDADDDLRIRLDRMNDLIDDAITIIRRISSDLRPGVLDQLGLWPALEWYSEEFSLRSKIIATISLPPDDYDLHPDLQTTLFRIYQEILTNVARHAQAKKVEANLKIAKNDLQLTVRDDGRGFTDEERTASGSLGILGMRERASQWGGSMEFEGKPGRGTRVRVQIPWPPTKQEIT